MFSRFLAVVTLFIGGPSVLGQVQKTENPSPAAPDFSKEAYVVERLATKVTAEDDGTGAREIAAQVKMVADAGVKAFAVLNFTYTSENEAVDIDYVRVRKPDGAIVKTPDYNIQDMPGEVTRMAPLYSDIHEKHVAVKGLAVGDVLEYLVRYRIVKPLVPGQFWEEYSFTKSAIANDEQLEINVPKSKYVKVVSPEFKPEAGDEGTRRIYRWKHSNLEVKEKDPNEPPRRIPPNPDVQITTFASWEDVGRWYGSLQKTQMELTQSIQSKAAELTKGLTSDDDKIHALYNFVSLKYHYVGLDFGIGRFQPHAADDVLDNGYGDCKDKHTLLATLLKAVGIDAWPVLIHATRKLDPDVPSPAQFNHVITVVPRGEKLLWLDTTPEVSPYGLLLLNLRDKQALMIPANKPASLVTTPRDAPFEQEQDFTVEGKLSADGTFTGHIQQKYRGDSEAIMRTVFRQVAESQWKEAMQRISYALNFGGDVSNVKISPPDELDKPFEISYDYVRKEYSDWEHKQISPPLPPMGVEIAKNSKDIEPHDPVLLGGIGKLVYRARVELPSGYSADVPADSHLVEPFAEYNSQTRIANGVITASREMIVKKQEVPLSDWERFHSFGRGVSDDESNLSTLNGTSRPPDLNASGSGKKGETSDGDVDEMFREAREAMQRRDFKRAQETYEKVIAKDPDYKFAHLYLGLSLAAQNQQGDALQQFRAEEEVQPGDPKAYEASAALMATRGRTDDAIEELRKLLKVDPLNRSGAISLSGLLMQQEKYADAVEVMEPVVKSAPASASLQYQLGTAYLKIGQPEKGVAHMKLAVLGKEDDAMMLNNVAWALADANVGLDDAKKFAQDAVEVLDDQSLNSETFNEVDMYRTYEYSLVWDTLGWVYFQEADFKTAEKLVGPSWLLGEDSLVGEHLGEIYEKEGKAQLAARAYEQALSVTTGTVFRTPLGQAQKEYQRVQSEIRARYKKLTGKEVPLTEIHRLPNGEWTKTPAEQLRQSREVKVSNAAKLSGSAQFIVRIGPEKVESVNYENGDEALKPLAQQLTAAHYPLEFPPGSDAVLVLRAAVECHEKTACVVNLLPAVSVGQLNVP
jgi:tetratricopeptide (TPR) repeat protein/transglutaminase-like putative cysteine protease